MKKVDQQEALKFFTPDEGELLLIYGAIGNGKTTLATSMVLEDLERGQVVYTTWRIDWSGFDERESFFHRLMKMVFFRKRFYRFDASNWHYLDVTGDDIWDKLSELNNCKIYFDDVIVQLFDSYEGTKFAKKKRQWAFTTRHYDRTIVLVTQRPSQVQVALRSQVNRFYKCVKKMSWPFLILARYEYQDMVDENVNDNAKPISSKTYFPSNRVLNAFRSKSLRAEGITPIVPVVEAWDYGFFARIWLFVSALVRKPSLKAGFSRARSASPMGLNSTNGVKDLAGVPTTVRQMDELPF